MASQLARLNKASVAAPDFRLAPEAPYPADVEDVISVYERLCQTSDNLVLAGLSSGGGLALSVLVQLRDTGKRMPRRAVLLSPMVDATGTSASWSGNASIDWIVPEAGLRWGQLYAGGHETSDPGISPINAKLDGLPPLWPSEAPRFGRLVSGCSTSVSSMACGGSVPSDRAGACTWPTPHSPTIR